MNKVGLGTMIERLEQANRAITMLEEMRERLVKVIGHTCPSTCEHQKVNNGD